jgi:DNA-binding XRE family transcriptional regulator
MDNKKKDIDSFGVISILSGDEDIKPLTKKDVDKLFDEWKAAFVTELKNMTEETVKKTIKEQTEEIYQENRIDKVRGEVLKEPVQVGEYRWYEGYGDPTVDEYAIPVIFNAAKKYRVENCLKEIIEGRGIKQGRIAELADISEKHMSEILSGKANPTIKTVLMICAILGITLDQAYRLVEVNDEK